MIMRGKEITLTQEKCIVDGNVSKASSSSKSWSRSKDPRIVRMPKAFGGKDRHSKVYTMRGLRDRRVRLSVSTATQLYDLQDRLGLNQPSKVVDWLLSVAKHEINELRPLQIPPGNCSGSPQPMFSDKEGLKISSSINLRDSLKQSNVWGSDQVIMRSNDGDENWTRIEEDGQCNLEVQGSYISSDNVVSRTNPYFLQDLQNNSTPYTSFFRWDNSSNLSLSHPRSQGVTTQQEDLHNLNLVPLSSTVSIPSESQFLVYQPTGITNSYNFPSNTTAVMAEFDVKQLNFQMLSPLQLSNSLAPPVETSSLPKQ